MSNNLIKICIGLLVLVVGSLLYSHFSGSGVEPVAAEEQGPDTSIGTKLAFTLLGSVACGILFLVFVMPKLGDMIGNMFYSAPGEVEPDPYSAAVAKVTQGDYEGAIEVFKELGEDNPQDRRPVTEISRLYLDKLEDPKAAAKAITDALEGREWEVDDAAFFLFRLVDINLEHLDDKESARALLNQAREAFPDSRYATTAGQKLKELGFGSDIKETPGDSPPPPPAPNA